MIIVIYFQSPTDLTVQAGERVTLVRRISPNLMEVRSEYKGTGTVPLTCLRVID